MDPRTPPDLSILHGKDKYIKVEGVELSNTGLEEGLAPIDGDKVEVFLEELKCNGVIAELGDELLLVVIGEVYE